MQIIANKLHYSVIAMYILPRMSYALENRNEVDVFVKTLSKCNIAQMI